MRHPYDTPLHAHLDAVGFPWRESRREMLARHGLCAWGARGEDMVAVPSARPLVDAMQWPLTATCRPGDALDEPFGSFSTVVQAQADARANFEATVKQLTPVLGAGQPAALAHLLQHRWHFGRASLTVEARPADMQRRRPAMASAAPLLAATSAGCRVELETGYLAAPSAAERAALDSFAALATLAHVAGTPALPSRSQRPFARHADDDYAALRGQLGLSADGAWLIFHDRAQLFLIPMQAVLAFELLTVRSGDAQRDFLLVRCARTSAQPLSLAITRGRAASEIAVLARRIAAHCGKPLRMHGAAVAAAAPQASAA